MVPRLQETPVLSSHKSSELIPQTELKKNKMEFNSVTEAHSPKQASDKFDAIVMERQNFVRFKQQMERKPIGQRVKLRNVNEMSSVLRINQIRKWANPSQQSSPVTPVRTIQVSQSHLTITKENSIRQLPPQQPVKPPKHTLKRASQVAPLFRSDSKRESQSSWLPSGPVPQLGSGQKNDPVSRHLLFKEMQATGTSSFFSTRYSNESLSKPQQSKPQTGKSTLSPAAKDPAKRTLLGSQSQQTAKGKQATQTQPKHTIVKQKLCLSPDKACCSSGQLQAKRAARQARLTQAVQQLSSFDESSQSETHQNAGQAQAQLKSGEGTPRGWATNKQQVDESIFFLTFNQEEKKGSALVDSNRLSQHLKSNQMPTEGSDDEEPFLAKYESGHQLHKKPPLLLPSKPTSVQSKFKRSVLQRLRQQKPPQPSDTPHQQSSQILRMIEVVKNMQQNNDLHSMSPPAQEYATLPAKTPVQQPLKARQSGRASDSQLPQIPHSKSKLAHASVPQLPRQLPVLNDQQNAYQSQQHVSRIPHLPVSQIKTPLPKKDNRFAWESGSPFTPKTSHQILGAFGELANGMPTGIKRESRSREVRRPQAGLRPFNPPGCFPGQLVDPSLPEERRVVPRSNSDLQTGGNQLDTIVSKAKKQLLSLSRKAVPHLATSQMNKAQSTAHLPMQAADRVSSRSRLWNKRGSHDHQSGGHYSYSQEFEIQTGERMPRQAQWGQTGTTRLTENDQHTSNHARLPHEGQSSLAENNWMGLAGCPPISIESFRPFVSESEKSSNCVSWTPAPQLSMPPQPKTGNQRNQAQTANSSEDNCFLLSKHASGSLPKSSMSLAGMGVVRTKNNLLMDAGYSNTPTLVDSRSSSKQESKGKQRNSQHLNTSSTPSLKPMSSHFRKPRVSKQLIGSIFDTSAVSSHANAGDIRSCVYTPSRNVSDSPTDIR